MINTETQYTVHFLNKDGKLCGHAIRWRRDLAVRLCHNWLDGGHDRIARLVTEEDFKAETRKAVAS